MAAALTNRRANTVYSGGRRVLAAVGSELQLSTRVA